MLDDSTYKSILAARAISREVAEARAYHRYLRNEPGMVFNADPLYHQLTSGQKWFVRKVVEQSAGLVMTRHAFPGVGEPVFAELRPDDPVLLPTRPHAHKLSLHDFPKTSSMRRHLKKQSHAGVLVDEKHPHSKKTRYLFPPSPIRNGKKVRGERAKRFDVHPLADLEGSSLGLIVLEGVMKADAALSAGWLAVTSVPAITLWGAPELDEGVVRWAKGMDLVGIVTDSDWYTNPDVIREAVSARDYLRARGVEAVHLSPPKLRGVRKTGLDDFLAADGRMEDLLIVSLSLPDLAGWIPGVRVDARDRNRAVLEWLVLHATPGGIVAATERGIARELGRDKTAAGDAIKVLAQAGEVKVLEKGEVTSYDIRSGRWENSPTKWFLIEQAIRPLVRTWSLKDQVKRRKVAQ